MFRCRKANLRHKWVRLPLVSFDYVVLQFRCKHGIEVGVSKLKVHIPEDLKYLKDLVPPGNGLSFFFIPPGPDICFN